VIRLLVLAALAITTSSAQATVLAEQPLSAQPPKVGGVMAAAFTAPAPQTGPAYATQESCPYHFDSNMPPATFCVYRGVAFGDAGEICATDVVVIWSSLASQARVSGGPGEEASASTREVYLGFIDDPELVVRAIVDSRQDDRAEMVEYTLGSGEAPQPLAGQITLQAVRLGSADVLSIDWREPRPFHPGSCAFASYSGTFFGTLRPLGETTAVDPVIVPGSARARGARAGRGGDARA
jgi:hypothetical protein